MASITVTVGNKTQVINLGATDSVIAALVGAATNAEQSAASASQSASGAAQSASSAALSASVANLFAAGVTDLGSINSAPIQTFDMGSLT